MKNEGIIERTIQLTIAAAVVSVGFFGFGGILRIGLVLFGLLIFTFAIVGFCPLYAIIGKNAKCSAQKLTRKEKMFLFIYAAIIFTAGAHGGIFLAKKNFARDFTFMNNDYKQVLYETGQENKQLSLENYAKLKKSFGFFHEKYSTQRPYFLGRDEKINEDLENIDKLIYSAGEIIQTGSLKNAHLELEKIRPITQNILKRNGFSMLNIALVDFHDAMEKMLDAANEKDGVAVIGAYDEADEKLSAVEKENNSADIQVVRKKLQTLLETAKENNLLELPTKAGELKSSFIKVYLSQN